MRVMPLVTGKIAPLAAMLVPQALAALADLTGPAGRSWRQRAVHRWMHTLRRQAPRRWLRRRIAAVLVAGLIVDQLNGRLGVARRTGIGVGEASAPNSICRCHDPARDLLVGGNQLTDAGPNIGGERLWG